MSNVGSTERSIARREQILKWLIKHDPNHVGFTALTIRTRLAYLFENDRQCHADLQYMEGQKLVCRVGEKKWTMV